jgi:carbamoyltransferase
MGTEMDFLVINDYVFEKTQQLDWQNKDKWMIKFKKD